MPDPKPEPDSAWYCQMCGKHHPIPPLARECETKHAAGGNQPAPGSVRET